MRCPQCGHENTSQPRFCRECGAPMAQRCPQCGASEQPDAKFCGDCGSPLRPGASTETTPQSEAPSPPLVGATDERNASVVFADISRYTSWAAATDASEIFYFLNEWYARVARLAERYEGHFSRAEGDCVMVVLGAPVACEDHPERACRLALDIRQAFAAYVQECGPPAEAAEQMSVHIGVNTGPVAAGRVSVGQDHAFDILGHTVNLARRLQTCAGAGEIYGGEATYVRAAPHFVWRNLPELRFKGITGGAKAYELAGARERRPRPLETLGPLVGRQAELAELTGAATSTRAGAGRVVSICGEPGIGKSRLVHEFTSRISADGFRVIRANCFPDERAIPHYALAQLLRGALGFEPTAPQEALAEEAMPRLREAGVSDPEDVGRAMRLLGADRSEQAAEEPEERLRLVRRLCRRMLLSLAADAPTAVVVEDLQWIDAASRDFLAHMVPWIGGVSLMLVCTFRPGGAPPWSNQVHERSIALGRLSPEQSEVVARNALAERCTPAAMAGIVSGSGGNPLFIYELARAPTESLSGSVPATVQDVIMARMDGLAEAERRTLSVSAVVGPRFRLPLVALALRMSPEDARSAAEDLVSAGWVRPAAAADEDLYEFDHILAREVAYGRLSRRDRAGLHLRIAEAIEQDPLLVPGDRSEVLAHHFFESDQKLRAAPYLDGAMRRAESQVAPHSVLLYGQRLLELLDSPQEPPPEKRLVLRAVRTCADACSVVGRNQDALKLLARGQELARELGDEDAVADARFATGMTFLNMGNVDVARAEMEAARAMWESENAPDSAALARLGLAAALVKEGAYEPALETFRALFESAGPEVTPVRRAASHLNYGEVCTYLGRPDEALEHLSLAEALNPSDAPDELLLANIHGGRGQAYLAKGRLAEAQAAFEEAARLAERSGDVLLQAEVLIDLAQCRRRAGSAAQALDCLRRGIELARDAESPGLTAMGEASLARTHLAMGEVHLARGTAERALAEGRAAEHRAAVHLAQRVLADIAESEGRYEEALRLRLDALALAVESGRLKDEAAGLLDVGRSQLALGASDEALRCFEKALLDARSMGAGHLVAIAAEQLARAHAAIGSHTAALEFSTEARDAALSLENDDLARSAQQVHDCAKAALSGQPKD